MANKGKQRKKQTSEQNKIQKATDKESCLFKTKLRKQKQMNKSTNKN